MKRYSLSHLEGHELLRALDQIVTNDCDNTALMLAHIAEVDARRLYRAAAHASMFSYCVHELHMSEETAYRRIRAARAARRFPAIFDLVADGRLNVTGVVLLAPHLVTGNAGELLAAAVHKTRKDIELRRNFSTLAALAFQAGCQLAQVGRSLVPGRQVPL